MLRPTCYKTFISFQVNNLTEYGFEFKVSHDVDDVEFYLILGRANPPAIGSVSAVSKKVEEDYTSYEPIAKAILLEEDIADACLIIMGPDCPNDEQPLYWSNEDGWVDRDSATRFNTQEALSGLGLDGTVALELCTKSCKKESFS